MPAVKKKSAGVGHPRLWDGDPEAAAAIPTLVVALFTPLSLARLYISLDFLYKHIISSLFRLKGSAAFNLG